MSQIPRIVAAALLALGSGAALAETPPIPRYEHILVIIAENQTYGPMMSGESTPNLKRLAEEYGVASNFYAEVHPSEGNYVAMLGGSTFGIHDDDAFYCKPGTADHFCEKSGAANYADHTVTAKSLADQLEAAGLTWKAYEEDIPAAGSLAIRYPDPASPIPGKPASLYAAKHNGFVTFANVQHDPALASKLVGFDQLDADLKSGKVPNYAHIVPNQCNEMHGLDGADVPPDCDKDNLAGLRARGDAEIGRLVGQIQASPFWSEKGNDAIVVTFDEDGKPRDMTAQQGCCGFEPGSPANFGGGHIVTIVITNHGPRHLVDPVPYNHYSLLRTTEDAFGITQHLMHAGDTAAGVTDMTPLFATGP